jgi:hypothetical protein
MIQVPDSIWSIAIFVSSGKYLINLRSNLSHLFMNNFSKDETPLLRLSKQSVIQNLSLKDPFFKTIPRNDVETIQKLISLSESNIANPQIPFSFILSESFTERKLSILHIASISCLTECLSFFVNFLQMVKEDLDFFSPLTFASLSSLTCTGYLISKGPDQKLGKISPYLNAVLSNKTEILTLLLSVERIHSTTEMLLDSIYLQNEQIFFYYPI